MVSVYMLKTTPSEVVVVSIDSAYRELPRQLLLRERNRNRNRG